MTTQIEKREQAAEVMSLRIQGWRVDRIAAHLNVAPRTVTRRITEYRASLTPEAVQDIRAMANARFSDLMSRAYLIMETPDMKPETKLSAIGEVRKLEAERLKLFGAYPAAMVDLTLGQFTADDLELVDRLNTAMRAQREAAGWASQAPMDDYDGRDVA